MEWIVILILVSVALLLVTKRWFWGLIFIFAGLASLFAMIASIVHFQILGAMGFFVLMVVCIAILRRLSDF